MSGSGFTRKNFGNSHAYYLDGAKIPGVTSTACGTLVAEPGVRLRWPDGVTTQAVDGPVTGLGAG